MRLSVITNTFNEGPRVKATCDAFISAGADEVVVCSDGTMDGCCDSLPGRAVVVRHDTPLGCGKSKFDATAQASGDVFMWVDAHQNVLDGNIRDMAQRAIDNGTIICPAVGNIHYDENWNAARIPNSKGPFYPNDEGIIVSSNAQYRCNIVPKNRCVSVGLTMSRQTYLRVGGWNRFRARHGSQERGMSLRAFMAGVDVEIDPTTILGHEFYSKRSTSRNDKGQHYRFNNVVPSIWNAWHSYMTVCSPEGFENHIKPWILSHDVAAKGQGAMKDPCAIADRDYFLRHCKSRPDSDLFALIEELVGSKPPPVDKGTASLEPAATRIIGAMARGHCLELGTGSGKGTLALLDGAMSVVSVDHLPQFTQKAKATITDDRVQFVTCPINSQTGFYDLSSIRGKFDCIVVDGPPGKAARATSIASVLPLLADGGFILEDDAVRAGENITKASSDFGLSMEMLPTRRGLALIKI